MGVFKKGYGIVGDSVKIRDEWRGESREEVSRAQETKQ